MKHLVLRFVADNSGATAIEYGLVAIGIAVATITAVSVLGVDLDTNFMSVSAGLEGKGAHISTAVKQP